MSARLPFGKFKGWALDEVPLAYLAWLHDECDLREPLATAVADELRFRLDVELSPSPAPQLAPPADVAREVAELIVAGYRALALRRHPDHGGDGRSMGRLNDAVAWCRTAGLAR